MRNLEPYDQRTMHLLSTRGVGMETLMSQSEQPLELELELLRAQGLNLTFNNGNYFFETKLQKFEDTTFCIVDIETNGSKSDEHQIIEIGAVKYKNGEIMDTYESFVKCNEIRTHISEITGITLDDTLNAPELKHVMQEFKLFLGYDIFVAHDIKFDYKFTSDMMKKCGLGELKNRSLCTIALAERSFSSFRYGLGYLNKTLTLHKEATHHRALSDALTATKLLEYSLENMREKLRTPEDLISYSKEAKRFKRPKFDPFIEEEVELKD
ncbi:MAG: 3'-5' exonuclease [Helicobacteraceae bacterium]|nr:3'-5' exonuclease [Helicobacteraceae bacterium]